MTWGLPPVTRPDYRSSARSGPCSDGKRRGRRVYVSGGYLEVVPSAVTVLADTALRAHDLDEAAALEAQERVRKEMAEQSAEFDYGRAQMELAEAAGRLRVLQQLKRRSR